MTIWLIAMLTRYTDSIFQAYSRPSKGNSPARGGVVTFPLDDKLSGVTFMHLCWHTVKFSTRVGEKSTSSLPADSSTSLFPSTRNSSPMSNTTSLSNNVTLTQACTYLRSTMCEAASRDIIGSAQSMPPSGKLTMLPTVKASKSPNPCRAQQWFSAPLLLRCCRTHQYAVCNKVVSQYLCRHVLCILHVQAEIL